MTLLNEVLYGKAKPVTAKGRVHKIGDKEPKKNVRGLPKAKHLQHVLRDVLRENGDAGASGKDSITNSSGGDSAAPRRSIRVGNPGADSELLYLVGRVGVLEAAIVEFASAHGKKGMGASIARLKKIAAEIAQNDAG